MIKQFLNDVHWHDTEYLIIDTPPGTSDEHISVMENLRGFNPDGAIIVTTPQVMMFYSDHLELSILLFFLKKLHLYVGLILVKFNYCAFFFN